MKVSDEDLLSTFLALACREVSGPRVAGILLARFDGLPETLHASERQVQDLGKNVFLALDLVRRLIARHLELLAADAPVSRGCPQLRNMWRERLGFLPFEAFEVAYLDASGRLIPAGIKRFADGTVGRAAVYSRRLIEEALRISAAGMVLAHNHTNGDVTPSRQDIALTRSIALSAELLDLSVHDHFIVSRESFFSFRDNGLV